MGQKCCIPEHVPGDTTDELAQKITEQDSPLAVGADGIDVDLHVPPVDTSAPLDDRDIELVQKTWVKVVCVGAEVVGLDLFINIFKLAPEAKELLAFRKPEDDDVARSAGMRLHGAKVVDTLAEAILILKLPDALVPLLKAIDPEHPLSILVKPEHYTVVGQALIKTLRTFLGESLMTPAVEGAYLKVFALVQKTMIGDKPVVDIPAAVEPASVAEVVAQPPEDNPNLTSEVVNKEPEQKDPTPEVKPAAVKSKPTSAKAKASSAKAKSASAKPKAAGKAKAKAKPKAAAVADGEPPKTDVKPKSAGTKETRAAASAKKNVPDASKDLAAGKIFIYQKIRLMILSARNLRNSDGGDGFGLSDPFCIVEIPGHKNGKFRTKVIDDTLDPEWNYVAEVSAWSHGDVFKFSVWDKDTFTADDLLGKCELGESKMKGSGYRGELQLHATSDGTAVSVESYLNIKVEIIESYTSAKALPLSVVRISETCKFRDNVPAWRTPKLHVTLVSAKNLRNADSPACGLSDPYCVCEIPGKQESRIVSPVIDDKLDPVWNFKALVKGYEVGDTLSVAIFDKDTFSADDLLGRLKVSADKIFNQFSGELQLTDTGKKGLQSYVTIKCETEEMDEEAVKK